MAVYRHYAECEVCKSITLIRVQAGHLPEYPVRIYCGNCKILLSGKVLFDEENVNVTLKLDNCNYIPKTNEFDYAIEISGELPTAKLSKVDKNQSQDLNLMYAISPFIRLLNTLGRDKYDEYFDLIPFLRSIGSYWPKIRRINELFLNKKWDLLKGQLIEFAPNKKITLDDEIDYLMAVHQLTVMSLVQPLKPTSFFEDARLVIDKSFNTLKKDNFIEFIKYIEKTGLNRLQEKVFILQNVFIEKFQYLIPGYSLFYLSGKSIEHSQLGVTTATLDDLKGFYIDCFETIMDSLELIIGVNNLIHRGSYQVMKEKRRDITTIDQFKKISNGKKIEYIEGEETFDTLLLNKIDNKLRNALGHSSTRYDGIQQLIIYYPKGIETDEESKKLYIIDFIKKCIDQFTALMNVGEIVYAIQKMKLLSEGQIPSGVNVVIDEKEHITINNYQNNLIKPKKRKNTKKQKRKAQKKSRKRNR